MAYPQMDEQLRYDPRTRRAAKLLGVEVAQVLGHLWSLAAWCLNFTQSSDLSGFELEELAEAAMWNGDPQLFVRAIRDCGEPGFLQNHNLMVDGEPRRELHLTYWQQWVGNLLDYRKKNADRQQQFRDRRKNDSGKSSNALRNGYAPGGPTKDDVGDGAKGGKASNSHVTVMSQSASALRNGVNVENRNVKNSIVENRDEGELSDSPAPAREEKPTRVSSKWKVTSEWYEWAKSIGWEYTREDLQEVANNFVDWHRKENTLSYDWQAEWRVWVRREIDLRRKNAPKQRASRSSSLKNATAHRNAIDPSKYTGNGKYAHLFQSATPARPSGGQGARAPAPGASVSDFDDGPDE